MSKIAIVFILAFIGCLLAALLADGVWAFYIYQLVYFLNPAHRWWGNSLPDISYSFITVAFMFSGLMMRFKQTSQTRYSELPLTKWVLGVLAMYIFMYFFALSPADHQVAIIELTKLFLIIGIAYKLINTRKKLDWAIWAYILGATYIGYVATSLGRNRGDRLEGIGTLDSPDSNGTAAILVPAIVFLLYYVWLGKNKYIKALAILCAALITNGIVLINSRGAFLATVAGASVFVIYMLFSKFQRANQRATAIFLVVAGLGGALYTTDALFWERMETLQQVTDEEGDRGGAHRVEFWIASFSIMKDYPLGLGARGYNKISANYIDPSLTKGGIAHKSVHSTWFQGLTEIGWQGLIIFIGLLYSCYRLSKRTKMYLIENEKSTEYFKVVAIETALLSFLVAATFINKFRSELLYWLILFLACGANIYYLQDKALVKDDATKNKVKSLDNESFGTG
jgi:hypothetical protein